jgi:hypothetical protein
MNSIVEKSALLDRIRSEMVSSRRSELTYQVASRTNWTVQRGPFRGMHLSPKVCWGDGDVATKLLATYEQELHLAIHHFTSKTYGAVINVGCAEGFYAVGLSCLLPDTPVFAFDISEQAQVLCKETAQLNGRADWVSVHGLCSTEYLERLTNHYGRCLIFIDCEGNEKDLLTAELISGAARNSDFVVECHDFMRPGTTEELTRHFENSHVVVNCISGPRNPNEISLLASFCDNDRWLVMSENRPCVMNWLICEAK